MNDALSQFRNAILATGLKPPAVIIQNKFHRFPGRGKGNANTAGWCILFPDGLGGCFGDFSSDLSENWQALRKRPFSHGEHVAFKSSVEESRTKAEVERRKMYAEAAKKAIAIWNSAKPAMFHEYLKSKQVLPLGIRVDRYDNLLVPLMDSEGIHSLQFIQPDGIKRFLRGGRTKGGYYGIALEGQPEKLLVCEGFATAATLYLETKMPIVVAFYAANLVPVVKVIRKQCPKAEFLICGDNDHSTAGNPGQSAAKAAARACGGGWTISDFTCFNPTPKDTDFNDLYLLQRVGK